MYPSVELFNEPADQLEAAMPTIFAMNEGNGRITRDNGTNTFTIVLTSADVAGLAIGSYGFRWLHFSDVLLTTCIGKEFGGRWRVVGGR